MTLDSWWAMASKPDLLVILSDGELADEYAARELAERAHLRILWLVAPGGRVPWGQGLPLEGSMQ